MYGSHHTIVRTLAIAVAPRIPAIPKGLANTTDNRILRIALITIAFLRSSKQQNQRKPVMLTMSFPAPHGPEDSAPQYSHLFFNVSTHQ